MSISRRQFLTIAGGTTLSAVALPGLLRSGTRIASAQAIPGAPTFRGGAGKSIQGPISLNPGLTVLRAQDNAPGNFSVTLFLPDPGLTPQQAEATANYSDSTLVYNEIAAFKGGAATMVGVAADHYMAVTSGGAFQISVEQPLPGNVTTVQKTSFTGRGVDVTPYFTLPDGLTSLSAQSSSNSFHAWLYHIDDLGGGPLPDGINVYDGRFFDFTFPDNQKSYPVFLPDAGPYLMAVNNVGVTDSWTLSFS